jgi:hypothetical protein
MKRDDEVDRLVEVITADCYNPSEQVASFYEIVLEEVSLPTQADVLGIRVDVLGIDIAGHGEQMTAMCRRGDTEQSLHLSNLVFAPDTACARRAGRVQLSALRRLERPTTGVAR